METTIMGCNVHYRIMQSSDPSAPVILFLHGWGCNAEIFMPITERLSDKATMILVDFPGHGKSGEPTNPWGVGEYAEMVYLLLTQLQILSVCVVAHSFGGRVSIMLANKYPDLIQKMVITGGAGIKKPPSGQLNLKTKRYKFYMKILYRLKEITFLSGAVESLQTKLRNHYGSPDYIRLSEEMRKTFVKVISEDLSPLLKNITAPVLLIWGDADSETPLWMGQKMEKEIPDAGLVIFEGRGHFAFLDEIQRFLLIIQQFLLCGKE